MEFFDQPFLFENSASVCPLYHAFFSRKLPAGFTVSAFWAVVLLSTVWSLGILWAGMLVPKINGESSPQSRKARREYLFYVCR